MSKSKVQKTNEELIREDNAIVLRGYDEVRWVNWAKNALCYLCNESEMDSIREIITREYPKLSDAMRNSLASFSERKKVSVLIWNKPMETLRAVLYKYLGTCIVNMLKSGDVSNPCYECFPGAKDKFIVCTDAEIYGRSFNDSMWFPRETMCVVLLGNAKKNNYLTEVLNSFVRSRRDTVPRQRTIFLFSGTRKDFAAYYGDASACELNRDSIITDWNPDAASQTNKTRHVTEPLYSFAPEKEKWKPKQTQTTNEIVQKTDAQDRYTRSPQDTSRRSSKNHPSEGRVVLDKAVHSDDFTPRPLKPSKFC